MNEQKESGYCPNCNEYENCTSEYKEDAGCCDAYKSNRRREMREAKDNYDKYTRHMVDKESTIGKYISELEQQNKEQESVIADLHELKSEKFRMLKKISELEQQNKELKETQLKLAQEVLEWRFRFNELSRELSAVTGEQRIMVIEETKEQIIFMAENRE